MRVPVNEPLMGEEEVKHLEECVRTNWVSSKGRFLDEFEQACAKSVGAKHGVAVSSGTAALHVALVALGVGPGDEVIVPSMTMIATAFAVSYTGATPIPVDSDPATGNMDPADVERRVTPRTKAIIPVHLYGHPVDMDPILALAKRRGIAVVEDAAEAQGALYKGKPVGAMGEVGCLSFYANKLVTTGEGGMCVTNDDALAARMRTLRDMAHSPQQRFLHEEIGFNYRMTNLQAAVGLAQVHRLDKHVAIKREVARKYHEKLKGVRGLELPLEAPWAKNVYWMYGVVLGDDFGMTREAFMKRLAERGVETRTYFIPVHEQPVYTKRGLYAGWKLPVAERLARQGLYLPSGLALTDAQMEHVVKVVREVAG